MGLLAGGGLFLGHGFATDPEEQTCVSGANVGYSCFSDRTILLGIGATLAGTGGALLAIGIAKSHSSPSITVGPGRIAVHHRAPLHLGVRRLFIRR